jgi:hypothetical protein
VDFGLPAVAAQSDGCVALLSFIETAIGTPVEQHDEIFEPFHQRLAPPAKARTYLVLLRQLLFCIWPI